MKSVIAALILFVVSGCASLNLADKTQVMSKRSADGIDCQMCKYTMDDGASFYARYDFADVGDTITTQLGRVVVIDYKTGAVK